MSGDLTAVGGGLQVLVGVTVCRVGVAVSLREGEREKREQVEEGERREQVQQGEGRENRYSKERDCVRLR
jgi:protein involved in polysaccharide export with SLBB domain